MGAEEDEFTFGDGCGYCTPQMFKADMTPKIINVCFRGIQKCGSQYDPPNGLRWKLEQTGNPCTWMLWRLFDDKVWQAELWAHRFIYPDKWITDLILWCDEPGGTTAFEFTSEDTCDIGNNSKVENNLTCELGDHYDGGHATVWWHEDDIPIKIASDMGFHPMAKNKFDHLYLPDDKQCVRIANRFDKTNILFLADETEFT